MKTTSFFIQNELRLFSEVLMKVTGLNKSALYRQALKYIFENHKKITVAVLTSSSKRVKKEQIFLSEELEHEIENYVNNCKLEFICNGYEEGNETRRKGEKKKSNMYNKSVALVQAIAEYGYYTGRQIIDKETEAAGAGDNDNEEGKQILLLFILKGIAYIEEENLLWKEARSAIY